MLVFSSEGDVWLACMCASNLGYLSLPLADASSHCRCIILRLFLFASYSSLGQLYLYIEYRSLLLVFTNPYYLVSSLP